ncbi:MAG: type I secretion system permease/ATPase [Pseudomonadota bacterium]
MPFLGSFKWLMVFSVAANALVLAPPLHLLQIYDRVLSSGSVETLIYITLIAIAAIALFGVAESVRSELARRKAAQFTADTGNRLFGSMTSTGSKQDSGQLLRDFSNLRSFLDSRTFISLFDLPFTPMFVLLLLLIHPVIGLVTVFGGVLLAVIAWMNRASTDKETKEARRLDGEASNFAQTAVTRKEDIRAMGLLPAVQNRWGDRLADSMQHGDEASARSAKFYGLSKAVRKIIQILVMASGGYLVIQGDISGGVLFAASMMTGRALSPIEQLIGGWDRISQARQSYGRLQVALPAADEEQILPELPAPKPEITCENVSFAVGAGGARPPIINNVSFHLPAGKIIAVVGPSGSGKSSLSRLLVGVESPSQGEVKLDGIPHRQWPDAQWAEAVGYVPQDISLFPGTVMENIARLEAEPDVARVYEAATRVGIHNVINNLPDGYNTQLGPGTRALSGGQRQLVALARALYSQPQVLILDEPDSHLDVKSELKLADLLTEFREQGKSAVVVTQRQSILHATDFVMTMKGGRISAFRPTKDMFAQQAKRASANGAPKGEPVKKRVGINGGPVRKLAAAPTQPVA